MGFFGTLLENIDRPSNAVQGLFVGGWDGFKSGWLQEKNYDFEQVWSPEMQKKGWSERKGLSEGSLEKASYVGSAALNLLLDPLNLIGIGLFKKGAKAAGELKGAYTSVNPNIITDYYGPMLKTQDAMDQAETFAKRAGMNKKEIEIMRKEVALLGAVGGRAEAVGTGLMNVAKMQLPKNRALYRETGINRPLFQAGERGQGKHALNDREMIGRAIFNRWVTKQAGKTGDTKVLDDVVSRAVYVDEVGDVTRPLTKGFYGYANAKALGDVSKHLTDDELLSVERHIMGTWRQRNLGQVLLDTGKKGITKAASWVGLNDVAFQMSKGKQLAYGKGDLVTVKRPQSKKTGQHYQDFHRSVQMTQVAKEVFNVKSLPKTVDELYENLSKVTYKKKNKITGKDEVKKLTELKKDKDGVWFTFSKPGSGVVEGGVNFRIKMKLDGDGFAVMSDEHNLMEAVLGRNLKRLITVSPPMHFNILRLKKSQTGMKLLTKDYLPTLTLTNVNEVRNLTKTIKKGFTDPEVRTHGAPGWAERTIGGRPGPGGKGKVILKDMSDVRKAMLEVEPSAEMLRKERYAAMRRLMGTVSISGGQRGMFSDSSSQ
jgi:hypothetical protein